MTVKLYKHSLQRDGGQDKKIPFPGMIALPHEGMDALSMLITFEEAGKTMVVLPSPRVHFILKAREFAAHRLMGKTLAEDPQEFSTGINPIVSSEEATEINAGRITLQYIANNHLMDIIGNQAAKKARLTPVLGPTLLTGGLCGKLAHPFVAKVTNPEKIQLASDYRAISIAEALQEVAAGTIPDMIFETLALWHLISTKQRVPEYLRSFDVKGFLGEF